MKRSPKLSYELLRSRRKTADIVIERDGSVVDSGIESSSNSMLLDDAARKTINRAAFAPFPEDSYKGESTHRFTADLEFIPV